MHIKAHTREGGYVALMATIVISAVLLLLSAKGSLAGWHARFNILGTEAKEQAGALAKGCADQALAALLSNSSYVGDVTTTTEVGTCYVYPLEFNAPAAGMVTIKTQAIVNNSYANLEFHLEMNDVHLDTLPDTPTQGTIVVITNVINDGSGAREAHDFTMHVSGIHPSLTTFSGSESGVLVTLEPGTYNILEDTIDGYSTHKSPGCSGTVTPGGVKFCTITNNDTTTTLTPLVHILNDNGGTLTHDDITVYIDNVLVTMGIPGMVSPGIHTITLDAETGYTPSSWEYQCTTDGTVHVAEGQNKTCIITLNDDPPPYVSCADTVLMLARDLHTHEDLTHEGEAAKRLLSVYAQVHPAPKVSVGSYPSMDGSLAAEIPPQGQLQYVTGTTSSAVTVRPTYNQWPTNTTTKIDAIAHNDGDATYIHSTNNGFVQTFTFEDAHVPAGAIINSVTLSVVAATQGTTIPLYVRVEKGSGTVNQSDGVAVPVNSTTYSTYTRTIYKNPFTNTAWTPSEVNSWTYGFGVKRGSGTGTLKITQMYLTIHYTMTVPGLYETVDIITENTKNGSDITMAITSGSTELDSIRHQDGYGKALIVVSPSDTHTSDVATALSTASTAKAEGIHIFTVNLGSGDANDDWAALASDSINDVNTQTNMTAALIENNDGDHFFIAPYSSDMPAIFRTIANLACPAIESSEQSPAPTTATLEVHTRIINDNGGSLVTANTTEVMTPSSASPNTFQGSIEATLVTLNPGSYAVHTSTHEGYERTMSPSCSSNEAGVLHGGESRLCMITFDDTPPPPTPPDLTIHLNSWKEVPSL